jgi:hypothetical protein
MRVVKISIGKTFSREEKDCIELWKAKVPLKEIRSQLQMSEATLRRILTVAKNNPDDPCPDLKAGSGKKSKVSPATMMAMKDILMNKPTIIAGLIMNKLFFSSVFMSFWSVFLRTAQFYLRRLYTKILNFTKIFRLCLVNCLRSAKKQ